MASDWIKAKYEWFEKICCRILKCGPIPHHLALIMDGNRRFARKNALNSVVEGHSMGFETLSKTLEWCKELGIKEVTVYAFSIENFKRTKTEVDGLMRLAKEKLERLLSEKENIQQNGVCFRFLGNLALLPLDVQSLIAQIVVLSMNNTKLFLNVCFAYTSHDEIARAVETVVNGVRDGYIQENDINDNLISKVMDSRHSKDPDLLIRTSGEHRFSDFLLYQSSYTCLYFDDVLWPDYNFWHLCRAILYYQFNLKSIEKFKHFHQEKSIKFDEDSKILGNKDQENRIDKFLLMFDEQYSKNLHKLANKI